MEVAGIQIIKITRTGDLKLKVRSRKYSNEITRRIKAGDIQMNIKTKQSQLVPFSIISYD
jgi:hypothetical protein